ncbi:MAG TPA: hypothetical protein VK536_02845 [Candidatus Limnocylindrales bacterium]|nr:hypothetical protein [Candidatus Limnocylindrales bacterium]
MARVFKAFRFDPQIYADFKELAGKSGYTMTVAHEKFMADTVSTCAKRHGDKQRFVCRSCSILRDLCKVAYIITNNLLTKKYQILRVKM